MIKSIKIAARDFEQQNKSNVKQLNFTDLIGHFYREDRNRSMRDGFYFRRNRSHNLIE